MAEDERERIHKRTSEGRRQARARGVKMGRRPKLNTKQLAEIRERLASGESQHCKAVHVFVLARLMPMARGRAVVAAREGERAVGGGECIERAAQGNTRYGRIREHRVRDG
nr:hypothetical protein [Nitrobacter hamburgensis]